MFCNESSDALSTSISCASLALISGAAASLDWEEELGKRGGQDTGVATSVFHVSSKVKGLYETFAHTDDRAGIAAVNPARIGVPRRSS